VQQQPADVLRISIMPFLARELVMPRIADLRARFPRVEVRVEANIGQSALESGQVHAALQVAEGPLPGLECTRLGRMTAAPVCSPELADAIHTNEDLARMPLIGLRGYPVLEIARRAGIHFDPVRVLPCDSYSESLRAAARGLGIALALFPITNSWVASERLVAPLPVRLDIREACYLLYAAGESDRPGLCELREWIEESYAELPTMPA
jgi:DNA-binding transcriptional LysR family regulator